MLFPAWTHTFPKTPKGRENGLSSRPFSSYGFSLEMISEKYPASSGISSTLW